MADEPSTDDNIKTISEQMSEIVSIVNRIETDMSYDRGRIDSVILRLSTVEAQQKVLIERVPRVETRMKDAVSDAVQAVVQPVSDQLDTLINRAKCKKLVIHQQPKKTLWEKLFQKKNGGGEKKK